MNSHVAFFGDTDHTFSLTPELLVELERQADTGIGSLCKRVFAGQFHHRDLIETIRLGLIGAGTAPVDAEALVAAYARPRPIAEVFPLAVAILETVWFGDVTKLEAEANG